MKRVIVVAAISGIISSIITFILFTIAPSGWLFFIIPAVMGTCVQKFGKITSADMKDDDKLENRVGWMCAGAVLFFILLTAVPSIIMGLKDGLGWGLLADIPFYLACALAVFYGYNRGVRAVVDSYYDSDLKEYNKQDSQDT